MTGQIYSYIFFLSLCENAINWLCSHQHIELLRKASLHDLLPPMSKAVNENCTNLPDNLTKFRYIFIDIKRWLNAKFAINLCFSTTQRNLRIRPLIPSHHLYNWIVLNSHTERIDKRREFIRRDTKMMSRDNTLYLNGSLAHEEKLRYRTSN